MDEQKKNKKVIFLDVDGVLNNSFTMDLSPNGYKGIDSVNLQCLSDIVSQTGAELILSSDWRYEWRKKYSVIDRKKCKDGMYLDRRLSEFGLKITDKTITAGMYEYRGYEIKEYLMRHPEIESFVILDDIIFDDFELYGFVEKLVYTSAMFGLTDDDVEKAICVLNTEEK